MAFRQVPLQLQTIDAPALHFSPASHAPNVTAPIVRPYRDGPPHGKRPPPFATLNDFAGDAGNLPEIGMKNHFGWLLRRHRWRAHP